MVDGPFDPETGELISRAPERADVVSLARELNRLGAQYVVVGGFAVITAGLPRTTGDIDLVINASLENEALVYRALELLPDQCVKELEPGEVAKNTVVRVADEVVVDLMAKASGIDYAEASRNVVIREYDGVPIPFANADLLWRMKVRAGREKDRGDIAFLRAVFASEGREPPSVE